MVVLLGTRTMHPAVTGSPPGVKTQGAGCQAVVHCVFVPHPCCPSCQGERLRVSLIVRGQTLSYSCILHLTASSDRRPPRRTHSSIQLLKTLQFASLQPLLAWKSCGDSNLRTF